MRQKAVPSMTTGRFLRPLIVPIIALSIVVAAVVAPASSVANCNPCLPPPNEWPQFQHDGQHTGYNAQETFLSTSTVPKLLERWKSGPFSLDYFSDQIDPVVSAGVLYVTDIAEATHVVTLHALDASSGAPLWSLQLTWASFFSVTPAAVYNGMIYVGMSNQFVGKWDGLRARE